MSGRSLLPRHPIRTIAALGILGLCALPALEPAPGVGAVAAPGTYKAQACGFANSTPQAYKGSVQVSTTKVVKAPAANNHGLKFSATVPSDPQRDEGEPAITTDLAGNMYTCGPTGFSQANDYA